MNLNPKTPCMKEDKRTGKMKYRKEFPKTFQSEMEIYEDGYPLYRTRNNDRQVARYIKDRGIVYLYNR